MEIYDLEGFSGHADQKTLIDWIENFRRKPKKIFLVHGEEGPANALSEIIEEKFNIDTIIPNLGDKINISKRGIEVRKGVSIDPIMLQQDIENEIANAYREIEALKKKGSMDELDTLIVNNYDDLKNKLIDLRHSLMDLNILISK